MPAGGAEGAVQGRVGDRVVTLCGGVVLGQGQARLGGAGPRCGHLTLSHCHCYTGGHCQVVPRPHRWRESERKRELLPHCAQRYLTTRSTALHYLGVLLMSYYHMCRSHAIHHSNHQPWNIISNTTYNPRTTYYGNSVILVRVTTSRSEASFFIHS